jgi:hypothetical protein
MKTATRVPLPEVLQVAAITNLAPACLEFQGLKAWLMSEESCHSPRHQVQWEQEHHFVLPTIPAQRCSSADPQPSDAAMDPDADLTALSRLFGLFCSVPRCCVDLYTLWLPTDKLSKLFLPENQKEPR